jgi:type IV pilus secretin PilQ/predicted competence protein
MRLKQLLGILWLAVMTSAAATASVSQLSGVEVKSRESSGVITILASGAFKHTEYRPTENLMLVDLAGVSLAQPDSATHTVYVPGVRSYRVTGYRSADGSPVARVELALLKGARVEVGEIAGGLQLRVTGAPAAVPSPEDVAAAANRTKRPAVNRILGLAVSRGEPGLSIEISGSAPLTAKTMKLAAPDRLVIDIANSMLEGRARQIAINSSGAKDVRVARYQDDPPVTRVVVDLAAGGDFDVVPEGNKLLVKLHEIQATPVSTEKPDAAGSSAPKQASLEPLPAVPEAVAGTAESRADRAASHFAREPEKVPALNEPPFRSASLGLQPAAVNAALQQQAQAGSSVPLAPQTSTSCTSGRYTGEPIGFNFKDLDLKDFFKVIQEISGLNVVLDPAVKGTVSIYLNDVPWDQALAIVLNNNGLECQMQGNVLRIATLETLKTEAEARRAQQEAQALAVPRQSITRYLSYGQSKDAAPIIKKFLSARGDVVADARSNSLIIEDIPSNLPKIEDLIRNLDRKTAEVEIEARVVASTRSFARDIGTQLGFGYGFGNNAIGGATANSPIHVTLPGGQVPSFITGQGDATTIPLFSNLGASGPTSGIEFSNATAGFRLDVILTAAESRGLIKILSRPQITTQNNVASTIKQGTQIPVVTLAQLGGPPTVQYIAAFLRLTVTPQITAENTIFLNIDVENTTPDFSRVSGSQLNPALDTQQATTSVLVKDGGTVVIGGVVQTQNNLAIAQVPILGSIPLLGNLFKHTTINTQTQELIFFITPKIIET